MLHLGAGKVIPAEDIVLIADLESTINSKTTKEFLEVAKEEGFIRDFSEGNPKSFIVTGETIYYSMISSSTLSKRLNFAANINRDL
ncbi:extracellular matrix regulator RemB [Halonatronum saccharophilum]|uniref:extracellular matrix regulator RemB n=1 Tax=Halonatronum saccharophilum TaxID=150060 RepID=UPI0004843D11|nr:extracellular matrix/biofilm biosynthesis regulator RemA family protein [Halonatronum saccharophilum]